MAIALRPLFGTMLANFDMIQNPKIMFWMLELGGTIVFFFWLALLSRLPTVWPDPDTDYQPTASGFPVSLRNPHQLTGNPRLDGHDIFFALAFMAVIDAFSVFANFNRALINHFHYSISLRMMFLAFIISNSPLISGNGMSWYNSQSKVVIIIICIALYATYGAILDKVRKPPPLNSLSFGPGTLHKYTEAFRLLDMPWRRALLLAVMTGGVGAILTMLMPPAYSTLIPVIHGGYESLLLVAMKTWRTLRYSLLTSPILLSTFCMHWGFTQATTAPHLTIPPFAFVALVLIGRLLLDLHLHTMFRLRADFQWARKNILTSTRTIFIVCIGLLLLEYVGLKLVTYIKPLSVLLAYAASSAGAFSPAAYAIAFKKVNFTHH